MNIGINKIFQGDSYKILKTFPDNFVSCVMTSPPYFNLRDYGVNGQIGLEKSPEEYLNNASHWDSIPLFETPEFPREARIQLLHKAHHVRKHIRKAAMQRKLKRFGVLGTMAASLFVNDWLQDLLLHNRYIRRITEYIFNVVTGNKK